MTHNLEPLIRFIEHLPKSGDTDLALLKSHLLCEEVLTKSIERHLRAPQHLAKAQLTFSHKIHLAHSLYPDQKHDWLWPSLSKLNEARNKLAHALDQETITSRIDAFVLLVESSHKRPDPAIVSPTFGRFHWSVFRVFAQLAAFAHYDPTAHKSAYSTLLVPEEPSDAA